MQIRQDLMMKKCLKYGTSEALIVLKEIIVLQRITSLDNHIRFITPQGNCPGAFFYCIEIIAKNVEFYNFVD